MCRGTGSMGVRWPIQVVGRVLSVPDSRYTWETMEQPNNVDTMIGGSSKGGVYREE